MIVRFSLDFKECDRARWARDAAYDGLFYTGVRTTGICRPVCPVRPVLIFRDQLLSIDR